MIINKVEWDSKFFDLNIGKIEILNEDDFNLPIFKEKVELESYDLVYVFSYNTILNRTIIEKAKLELVDILITLSKDISPQDIKNCHYNLYNTFNEEDLKSIYSISENISKVSRFSKERIIGEKKSKALFRKWVDNALNASFCDGILVERDDGKIVGIHLVKTDEIKKIGYCSLIGVDPNIKGKGIGRKLWEQAFAYWFTQKKIDKCLVPFSIQNVESFNFHLKMGFNSTQSIKYVYHYKRW